MRPSRSRPALSTRHCLLLLPLLLLAPCALSAQRSNLPGGVTPDGAPELVFPTGGRMMAVGQAAVADTGGTEDVWWNPALLAWVTHREAAIHFSKALTIDDNAAAFLWPVGQIGTVTVGARLFNYGDQPINPLGGSPTDTIGTGTFSIRTYVWSATFAAPVADRFSAGVTYKFYQFINSCNASDCSQTPTNSASTSAFDLGVDWRLPGIAANVAASLQNVGPALQIHDSPQRDPLPTRLTVGGEYTPTIPSLGPNAELRVDAALITMVHDVGAPGIRLGGELTWMKKLHVRGGYALYSPMGSGPSGGIGFNTGRLQLDLARFFSDQGSSSGEIPTYISLRFVF